MTTPTSLDDLVGMTQTELDDLYKSLEPGPIPEGDSKGAAIVHPGTWLARIIRWFAYTFAWQGKVFTKNANGQGATLMNKLGVIGVKGIVARVDYDKSWIDGKDCIFIDYSKTSLLAQKIRDEIRLVCPGLYLGKVWWGKTRLIDFALRF